MDNAFKICIFCNPVVAAVVVLLHYMHSGRMLGGGGGVGCCRVAYSMRSGVVRAVFLAMFI